MLNKKEKVGEMENGSWYKFFHSLSNPVFTDEACQKADGRYEELHDSFLERYLSPGDGPLLALGVGYGLVEIPIARRGYQVIGLDSDRGVLEILRENAKYAKGNLTVAYGDLNSDFYLDYQGRGIQACISFGLLEHFSSDYLPVLIEKQFCISPLLICDIPIRTPATLKTFHAERNPEGHVDYYGIYRNFWIPEYWKSNIFGAYTIVADRLHTEYRQDGQIDVLTLVVRS
jgi:hypothetical protein